MYEKHHNICADNGWQFQETSIQGQNRIKTETGGRSNRLTSFNKDFALEFLKKTRKSEPLGLYCFRSRKGSNGNNVL